ncbi:hypothetical protein KPATCC21470_0851 [Kitasatospora purpeofusca]
MTATTTTDRLTLRITGGRPLHGTTTVQGSKNIALHLYAAAILADQPLVLTGAPAILDTGVCAEILHRTGTRAAISDGEFETRPADSYFPVVPDDLGRCIRTTPVIAAALLARSGKVTFPLPGGDAFCSRYIDLHLAAMEAAGADVEVRRPSSDRASNRRSPSPPTSWPAPVSVSPGRARKLCMSPAPTTSPGASSRSRPTVLRPPPWRSAPRSPAGPYTSTASRPTASRRAWYRCSPTPGSS